MSGGSARTGSDDAPRSTGIAARIWHRWSALDRGWRASILGLAAVALVLVT